MKKQNVSKYVLRPVLFLFSIFIIIASMPFLAQASQTASLSPSSVRPDGLDVTVERNFWNNEEGETFSFFISNNSDMSVDLWRVEIPLDRHVRIQNSWWHEDVKLTVRNETVLVIRGENSIAPNSTYNGGCNFVYLESADPTPTSTPTLTPSPTPTPTPVITGEPTVVPTTAPTPTAIPMSSDDESLSDLSENALNESEDIDPDRDTIPDSTINEDFLSEETDEFETESIDDMRSGEDDSVVPAGMIADYPDPPSDGSGLGGNILNEGSSKSSQSDDFFLWPLIIIIIAVALGGFFLFALIKKKRDTDQKRPFAALVGDFMYGANEEVRNLLNDRVKPLLAGIMGKLKGGSFDQSFAEAQSSGASDEIQSRSEEKSADDNKAYYSDAHRLRPPKK